MSWLVYAVLSAFFAALVGIVGKIGVSEVDPVTATAIRAVIMAFLSVLFAYGLGKTGLSKVDRNALLFISLAGLFGALSWMAYFKALSIGEASRVIPVDRASVLVALVLAVLILGESLTIQKVVGGILVFIGVLIISL